ncbi:MAG: hypothetical protein HKO53_10060 [Gemmatimonadetes bacterium]|nr:hypothetical protein [Gemmatimonadota bacterium]
MNQSPNERLAWHRRRIEKALATALEPPPPPEAPATAEGREHLLDEARDLYWNELEWERITDEEKVDGGALPELAFAGLLAFVRGLLIREVMEDSLAPADPRPEVVEDLLLFLAERTLALEGEEGEEAAEDFRLTEELTDLVLYQLHGLSKEEVARAENVIRGE